MTGGLAVVGDVLAPLGAVLTVVTAVGTVHWLKGKHRIALLAPLSVVSVFGIVGTFRVAKPDSPWARWRYDADRMRQACARFGVPATERPDRPVPPPAGTAGFALVVVGVVGGVPFGAVTSLVGGVLLGHALLARAGRPASARVGVVLVGAAVVGQAVILALTLPDPAAVPGAVTTVVVAAGTLVLWRSAGDGAR